MLQPLFIFRGRVPPWDDGHPAGLPVNLFADALEQRRPLVSERGGFFFVNCGLRAVFGLVKQRIEQLQVALIHVVSNVDAPTFSVAISERAALAGIPARHDRQDPLELGREGLAKPHDLRGVNGRRFHCGEEFAGTCERLLNLGHIDVPPVLFPRLAVRAFDRQYSRADPGSLKYERNFVDDQRLEDSADTLLTLILVRRGLFLDIEAERQAAASGIINLKGPPFA